MTTLDTAAAPEGLRLYAIGDVHGCLDALEGVWAAIRRDLETHPAADWRVVLLGDYIDRGPDSRGVLEWVAAREADLGARLIALKGNHDAFLLDFLERPEETDLGFWFANGGDTCLASYGLPADRAGLGEVPSQTVLRDRLAASMGPMVRGMLDRLATHAIFGDYLFVHAGLRPGVALSAQDPDDLIWIREPFLSSDADFGAVVVHGHTPRSEVEVRPNRIGLDTGAVFGGVLSCLVLEGRERALLRGGGRVVLA